jgi:hypothetical protein
LKTPHVSVGKRRPECSWLLQEESQSENRKHNVTLEEDHVWSLHFQKVITELEKGQREADLVGKPAKIASQ